MIMETCVLYIVDFMHVLMYDAKLRIIQSYEQVLVPMGSDKRGPTICIIQWHLEYIFLQIQSHILCVRDRIYGTV